MDPMALSVLNETQMAAVEYVMERSKVDSECVYTDLKSKVLSLGYSERDLARCVCVWGGGGGESCMSLAVTLPNYHTTVSYTLSNLYH